MNLEQTPMSFMEITISGRTPCGKIQKNTEFVGIGVDSCGSGQLTHLVPPLPRSDFDL